jgi:D-arabinose 1-dehydrogenase-like Zn-dependent alcohol dehydrogenase
VRAARLDALGAPLQVEEVADPQPSSGEVLVEVAACGIGLTVVHYCSESLLGPAQLPRIPGHEFVGTIRSVGDGVDPRRVGETVVSYFYLTCGECRACLGGVDQLCERFAGTLGSAIDGGYAELVAMPARNAIRIPDGIDAVSATTIPDAIATPVHVARRAAIAAGERVAVLGAGGGVGIHMIQVARALGAEAFALDLDAHKLAFAERELGVPGAASGVVAPELLPPAWEGRADVVVDFVGSAEGMRSALEVLAAGGRLVCLTGHTGESVRPSSRELVFRQLAVLGSRYASRSELLTAAELVRAGRVRPVISERVGLDGVESVHEMLRRGELLGRGALVLAASA